MQPLQQELVAVADLEKLAAELVDLAVVELVVEIELDLLLYLQIE